MILVRLFLALVLFLGMSLDVLQGTCATAAADEGGCPCAVDEPDAADAPMAELSSPCCCGCDDLDPATAPQTAPSATVDTAPRLEVPTVPRLALVYRILDVLAAGRAPDPPLPDPVPLDATPPDPSDRLHRLRVLTI